MHQQIYQIAYQLNTEGKVPSVALIKARLSKPIALPIIIQALQRWKASPQLGKPSENGENTPETSKTEILSESSHSNKGSIEARLSVLEHKVDKILALVEALVHR